MQNRFVHHSLVRAGFTMLELQVAVVLLAFGMATLASLMTTQTRVLNRVQGDYKPGATIVLTRSNDPWVRQLRVPARISVEPISQPATPSVTVANSVTIVSSETALGGESITVTADVSELP